MFASSSASAPGRSGCARRRRADFPGSRSAVLAFAGTRPECIKLAPVIHEATRRQEFDWVVVNSGQHRDAVRRTFRDFGVECAIELKQLPAMPNLRAASERLRREFREVMLRARPAMVLVQGDTLTAYSGARAGRDVHCPVVHVEAGLRAPSPSDPFPEEWFRRRIARHAQVHFAPSDSAQLNLLAEGIDPAFIHRVGNTGIDSLRSLLHDSLRACERVAAPVSRVLVTLHRRENWDANADIICDALVALAHHRPDLKLLIPVHPNPRIACRLRRRLEGRAGFQLVAPMSYRDFIETAATSALIISDSGGIQEEAPHLGVPLLVPRSCTERPEGLATGFVGLVRVEREAIVRSALAMLAAPRGAPLPFDSDAPFGDGFAARRIIDILERTFAAAAATTI